MVSFKIWQLVFLFQWQKITSQPQSDDTAAAKALENKTNEFVKSNITSDHLHGARWELQVKNKPVKVYHTIEILDLSSINDGNGEYRLDMNLKQRWEDKELALPFGLFVNNGTNPDADNASVLADSKVLNELWGPDAYMPNARDAVIEKLITPLECVRIFKNLTVIYYANIHTTLGCPMNFQWYPLDVQFCEFILESYIYNTNYVLYEWEYMSPAVILPKNFHLRRYTLRIPLINTTGTMNRFGKGTSYSRITVHFVFERQIQHHLIQVYFPTFLIVALSWFNFWLGLDAIPGRVSLLVTCMLTLVTMYSNAKGDLPPVTYIKMMDVWMAGCLGFVFAAMSEFIIVKYMSDDEKKNSKKIEDAKSNLEEKICKEPTILEKIKIIQDMDRHQHSEFYKTAPNIMNQFKHRKAWEASSFNEREYGASRSDDERDYYEALKRQKKNRLIQIEQRKIKKQENQMPRWKAIDKVSRVAFPVAFLCFCCVYWPFLLIGSRVWQKKEPTVTE